MRLTETKSSGKTNEPSATERMAKATLPDTILGFTDPNMKTSIGKRMTEDDMTLYCIKEETGWGVERNDKFWGCTYSDGRETCYGWTTINKAEMHETWTGEYGPERFTYKGSPYVDELKSGRTIKVKRVTGYQIVKQDNNYSEGKE